MTYLEIANTLIGPVIAAGLVLVLWLWRWARKMPPMTLRLELVHIGGAVATIAIGALLEGQSWKAVLTVSATALMSAMGWNSSTSLPPTTDQPKPASPDVAAALETLRAAISSTATPSPKMPEPVPPEHIGDPPPVTLPTGSNEVRP